VIPSYQRALMSTPFRKPDGGYVKVEAPLIREVSQIISTLSTHMSLSLPKPQMTS
jgi:hypothetical protein